ncbi:hypothetical protein DPMN_158660 [Dreissena polymorpha]|uniref:Uncharacterized protein n=1 Tax=Dreissena polymorpha TaxID=45954 RepID=A0A9D4EK86_DREPO|nr:hypothetical protein DPMN_158660 [Dreissena polymorpha]
MQSCLLRVRGMAWHHLRVGKPRSFQAPKLPAALVPYLYRRRCRMLLNHNHLVLLNTRTSIRKGRFLPV